MNNKKFLYLFSALGVISSITGIISFTMNDATKLYEKIGMEILKKVSIFLFLLSILYVIYYFFFRKLSIKEGVNGVPVKFKYLIRRCNPFALTKYLEYLHQFQHKHYENSLRILNSKENSPWTEVEKSHNKELLRICQKAIHALTGTEFSIHIKLFKSKTNNQLISGEDSIYNSVFETYTRLPSKAEFDKIINQFPARSSDELFTIQKWERNTIEKLYEKVDLSIKTGNNGYKKNYAYDYVFGPTKHYWLSNNLTLDEKNKYFISNSENWNNYYNSLGVFIISCPLHKGGDDNIEGNCVGLLIIDSHLKNVFQEKIIIEAMGYFAHRFFDYFNIYIRNNVIFNQNLDNGKSDLVKKVNNSTKFVKLKNNR